MTIQQSLDQEARDILTRNDRGGYTVPTAGLYPYQWNWDSAFAALGFAEYDLGRAWAELETLFAGQWEDGMVPHILFHQIDPGYFPGPDVWQGRGPVPSSGVTTSTFINGSKIFGPAFKKASLKHCDAQILKAISDESTS